MNPSLSQLLKDLVDEINPTQGVPRTLSVIELRRICAVMLEASKALKAKGL